MNREMAMALLWIVAGLTIVLSVSSPVPLLAGLGLVVLGSIVEVVFYVEDRRSDDG